MSAYTPPYRLWVGGRGVARQPNGGWRLPSFLGTKLCRGFGQPAFFLVGNRMTTIAFEKAVFFKGP